MLHIGFAVRLLYFLLAPFTVLSAGDVIPMTGVLINIIVLVGGFIAVELLRDATGRHPLIARVLARQLRFAEYYRAHPPRNFLYYMVYPLIFPYWLINRRAREEFGLYRGFTIFGVVLLVVFGVFDYFMLWWPEIGVAPFVGSTLATLFLQIGLLITLLLPLAVTIVGFQLAGRSRAVWTMLGAAALSVGMVYLGRSARVGELTPVEVAARARLRSEAAPERAHAAQDAALRGVWDELRGGTATVDGDGWVGGDTLERAHTALTDFYRPDEAAGFNVHVWPVDQPAFALLQCYQNNHPPPWRVMAADGHIVADPQVIPAELYNVKPTRNRRRIHPVEQPAGG
ncbi:MAG: hypothetical protein JNK56_07610 [Myxococcales bacterium]|nr:hypothetical protein [Myxococcales bacterium]